MTVHWHYAIAVDKRGVCRALAPLRCEARRTKKPVKRHWHLQYDTLMSLRYGPFHLKRKMKERIIATVRRGVGRSYAWSNQHADTSQRSCRGGVVSKFLERSA
jgi:hypothetical protein